jgi:hypothetical protein
LLGILLLAGVLHAPAARGASFARELPDRVVPGQEIVLRWSDLPPAVEEVEILLSLDGGRSFPIRVSPQLDVKESAFRWRVPGVGAGQAILRLRLGTAERELEGPVSRTFRISGATSCDLAPRESEFHEGYLWTGVEPIHDRPTAGMHPREARFEALERCLANAPRDPAVLHAPVVRARACIVRHQTARSSARDLPTQATRLDPLRI